MDIFTIAALLTGLVMVGEAIALLIGMHLLSAEGNPWVSPKNDALLISDILMGGALVALAFTNNGLASTIAFWLIIAALLTHGYREWEYLARAKNAFCANGPLFGVNNLKIIGLLLALVGIILST